MTRAKLKLVGLFISGALIIYGIPMIALLAVLCVPVLIKWRLRHLYGLTLVAIMFLYGAISVLQKIF